MPPRKLVSANIHITGLPDDLDEEITRGVLTSEVLSRSTVDLSQFKNERGEFKQWLHIFHRANRRSYKDTYLKVTTVLPWCSDQKTVDVEFHRAVVALEGYSKYPLNWRSFSWRIETLKTSPTYGVFCSNLSREAFHRALMDATDIDPTRMSGYTEIEFWERMKKFVLVPRADGTPLPVISTIDYGDNDANSGLGEAGADSLRER